MKTCQWHEGCIEPPVRKERFCKCHRRAMLALMESSGYLQPLPERETAGRTEPRPADPFEAAIDQGNYP